MDLLEFLEKRIGELKEEKAQAELSMAVIRDKIKHADDKRGTQPGTEHYHKWSSILKGLERDLDKMRSVVVGREAEVEQKQKKLEQLRVEAASKSQAGADISKRIMEMTDEEVANLTMEDIALLQEYELSLAAVEQAGESPDTPAESTGAGDETKQAEHKEITEKAPPARQAEAPDTREPEAAAKPQPRGNLLAGAVKKFAQDVGTVTLAELHAALDGYAALQKASDLDPEKERLKTALAVVVEKSRKEVARVAAKLKILDKPPAGNGGEGEEP